MPGIDDDILLGLVAFGAGFVLLRSIRSAPLRQMGDLGALVLAASLVLAGAAGLYLWHGPGAGLIGLGLLVALIWIPYRCFRLAISLMRAGRFRAARAAMVPAIILHPSRCFRTYPRLFAALACVDGDDAQGARERLKAIHTASSTPPLLRQIAALQLARLDGDWASIAAEAAEPALLGYRLVALGEMGDIAGMLRAYREAGGVAAVAGTEPHAVLFLLAFGGRSEAVRRLLEGSLRSLPPDAHALWTATADLAAGRDRAAALAACARLSKECRNVDLRQRAARRLAWPAEPPRLAGEQQALLDEAEALLDKVDDSALAAHSPRRWPLVTAFLVAANVTMFGVEQWQGGSADADVLYKLGSLWIWPSTVPLEPWRIGAALFLHYGTAHILLNMIALAVFGNGIERRLGSLRFLVLYLGAGLASNASLVGLTLLGILHPNTWYVGASGAIMGLVGALAALALRAWRRNRAAARRNLSYALLIICLEGALDVFIPNVTLAGHLCGAVAGFLITLAMPLRRAGRDRSSANAAPSRTGSATA